MAVVDGDDVILDEPCCKPCREDVEGEKVATQKEEELKHVETEKGMPEPAECDRPLWLEKKKIRGEVSNRGGGDGRAYLYGPISRADAHGVCGRKPPYSYVLCSPGQGVDISDALLKRDRLLSFLESKRRLHLQRDGQDKASAAQATHRGDEEIGSLLARTRHARAVGQ